MRFSVLAASTLLAVASAVPFSVGGGAGAGINLGGLQIGGGAKGAAGATADGHAAAGAAAGVQVSVDPNSVLGMIQGLAGTVSDHCGKINQTVAGGAKGGLSVEAGAAISTELQGIATSVSGFVGQLSGHAGVKGGLLSGAGLAVGANVQLGGDVATLAAAVGAIFVEISATIKGATAVVGQESMSVSIQILGGAISGMCLAMQLIVKGFLPAFSAALSGSVSLLSGVLGGTVFSIAAGTFCL